MKPRAFLLGLFIAGSLYGCGVAGIQRIVAGFSVGTSSDRYIRFIAADYIRRIGDESVFVQNMPGAESIVAADYLFGAKPDGFTIGAFSGDFALWKAMAARGRLFLDPRKFEWLGGVVDQTTKSRLVFALPPGTDKFRVDRLRRAFMDTIRDPVFVGMAKGNGLSFTPITAEELGTMAAEFTRIP